MLILLVIVTAYFLGFPSIMAQAHTALTNVVAELLTADRCDLVTLPWSELRFQHTQAVRAALQERYTAATANKMLAALRQTLCMAWNLGYLSAEEYQRAVDLKPISGEQPEAATGRALKYGEWMALLSICAADEGPAGVRDAGMIALFKIAGLRWAEMAALNLEDYDREEQTLTVRGKRNKTRVVPIEDDGALDALADWLYLLYNSTDVQPALAGPLFTCILKGGRITDERLSDQGVYRILDTRRQQANMASFTPHDLRRTFAGDKSTPASTYRPCKS